MTFNHYDIGSNPIDPSFFYDEVWLALCRLRRRSPPSPDYVGGKGMGGYPSFITKYDYCWLLRREAVLGSEAETATTSRLRREWEWGRRSIDDY